MIDGEETRGRTSGVASRDPSDPFSPKSNGSDASPTSSLHYSSCGESEFERYCSANSIMGTPSMCSSTGPFNDCVDSEFGSLKSSFEFGDDSGLENFSLGPSLKLSYINRASLGSRRSDFCEDNIGPSHNNGGVSMLWEASNGPNSENPEGMGGNSGNPNVNIFNSGASRGPGLGAGEEKDTTVHSGAEKEEECLKDVRLESELPFDGRQMEREENGNSSTYEHSESEDSMYGADDDDKNNLYFPRNAQCQQVAKAGNQNLLLLSSSVAFGSDDWDDFELERCVDPMASLVLDKFQELKTQNIEREGSFLTSVSVASPGVQNVEQPDEGKDQMQMSVCSEQARDAHVSEGESNNTFTCTGFMYSGQSQTVAEVGDSETVDNHLALESQQTERCAGDTSASSHQFKGIPDERNYVENCCVGDVLVLMQNQSGKKDPYEGINSSVDREMESTDTKEAITTRDAWMVKGQEPAIFDLQSEPRSIGPENFHNGSNECGMKLSSQSEVDLQNQAWHTSSLKTSLKHSDLEASAGPGKTENLELNDFYDEIVHDMEEILLDSGESYGARHTRLTKDNKMFQTQVYLPLRDGGWTATSSSANSAPSMSPPLKIDGVKVIGAKQKKGDVSLGERLVGVKEYTVYVIRVWSSEDQWQVERRYRDFFTLYRRLKSLFADQGWVLPPPWLSVEKESRKLFGNASPKIVAERSVLIQECLHSVLHSRFYSRTPGAILRFLASHDKCSGSPPSDPLPSHSSFFSRGSTAQKLSSLGKTVSLVVEIRPQKSTKQLLEAQQYTCAGCHRYFDDGMTLVRDLVQAFGWGKPRLCEYTGQLFCPSCHTNETAVLPARVLHHWDFNRYPVSQLAKSYLDSIHEQPMLCVSAVNPLLFSRVPALYHVMSIRKNIGTMLAYVRCPFRMTINKGLGGRRYLLDSNDFFALKDLIDLSKGAFAALPLIVETISKKIVEHITEQCLVCCDVGVPCSARQACNDPSSLIFPFQEGEVEKCPSCELVFHKHCFKKITNCPCGARLGNDDAIASTNTSNGVSSSALELPGRSSTSTAGLGFIAGLFSRSKTDRKERRDSNTVILMGSLPSNDL